LKYFFLIQCKWCLWWVLLLIIICTNI
jgi:hypothetical protein